MQLNRLITKTPVSIENIFYVIDRYGIFRPLIQISPPLQYKLRNDAIIENKLIHLPAHIEAGYDNIFKGSKINIFEDEHFFEIIELVDNDNADTTVPLILSKCPSCNSELRTYDGKLVCTNKSCLTQVTEKCIHFIRSININLHGTLYHLLHKLITAGYIKSLIDIFTISIDDIIKVENTTEKQAQLFKLIVDDVIGKCDMTSFLYGFPIHSYENCRDVIQEFVSHQKEEHRKSGMVFDIRALLHLKDETIKYFNLIIPKDSYDHTLSIRDQLDKLPEDKQDELHEIYCENENHFLAEFLNFITNEENVELLKKFHDIHLIGCNY